MARTRSAAGELAKVFAASPQPVYLLSGERVIVYANQACADWLHCEVDQLMGARCDYHSAWLPSAEIALAAGLCPPPDAFTTPQSSGVITFTHEHGLERRQAHFTSLQSPEDPHPALLAIAETVPVTGPLSPASPSGEATPAELHVLLRWLRQTISARGVLDRWAGELPAVLRVRRQYETAAGSHARVLIVGPPGAGREDLARGIHYYPAVGNYGPLIPIECATVDAESLQMAVRSLARHKTQLSPGQSAALLLIDADQLSAAAQQELAGFLDLPGFEVRTLATARSPLLKLAEQGVFRADLAYALSTLVIKLPSLRERRSDFPLVVQALVEEFNAAGGKQVSGCTPEALERLFAYDWPGDVAQLSEAIHEACRRAAATQLTLADLPAWLRMAEDAADHPVRREPPIVLDEFLAEIERELLSRALYKTRGNKSKAAQLLGISRPRLLRRLEQLGLAPPRESASPTSEDFLPQE